METAYIETTIPSLYTGRPAQRLVEAARQNLTRIWWDHHRHEFDLVCSQTVLDECAEGDAEMAKMRGELLDGIPLLELTDDVVDVFPDATCQTDHSRKGRRRRHSHCSGLGSSNRLFGNMELQAFSQPSELETDFGLCCRIWHSSYSDLHPGRSDWR